MQSETNSGTETDYVYFDGIPLSVIQPGAATISALHTDNIATIQRATNASKTIVWTGNYEPFGAVSPTTTITQNQRFLNNYADNTGYYHNGFRDRNPSSTIGGGRYLQPDLLGIWIGTTSLNPYVYAGENPFRFVDLFGLSTLSYNGNNHTLTITGNDGSTQSFPAYNNADSHSQGSWPSGTYPYQGHMTHPDDSPNSAYGSNGGYKFDVPDRTGMEVHSGQETSPDQLGRTGPEHATRGCIRTTDQGTEAIQEKIDNGDPPTSITVNQPGSNATPPAAAPTSPSAAAPATPPPNTSHDQSTTENK
jgi:RHS repeat-associated protein